MLGIQSSNYQVFGIRMLHLVNGQGMFATPIRGGRNQCALPTTLCVATL